MSPALSKTIPDVSSEEHGQLGRIVDEMERAFRRLASPEELARLADDRGWEPKQTPEELPDQGLRVDMNREGDAPKESRPQEAESSAKQPTRPAETQSQASKGLTLDNLTRTTWKLLRALRDLEAFDAETAVSRDQIVSRAKIGNANSKNVRDAFKSLRALGLIETRRNVGTWLTRAGLDALKTRR
jgi:hypothetical protein